MTGDEISTELSKRRTGMSFQRTRMSADRTLMSVIRTSLSLIGFGFTIFQFFQKLHESEVLRSSMAARHFGVTLVFLGIGMLGTMGVWAEPFVRLRLPKIFNLRTDPYEFADITSNTYWDWVVQNAHFVFAAQAAAAKFAETFKDFPPVQKPNTFTIDDAMAKMGESAGGG